MKHGRAFWKEQVAAWRRSKLSQRAYCEQKGLAKRTLGYWSWKLGSDPAGGNSLVEVGRSRMNHENSTPQGMSRPIEVVVEGRYLLRLWPGTAKDHMSEVLSVLERRG